MNMVYVSVYLGLFKFPSAILSQDSSAFYCQSTGLVHPLSEFFIIFDAIINVIVSFQLPIVASI